MNLLVSKTFFTLNRTIPRNTELWKLSVFVTSFPWSTMSCITKDPSGGTRWWYVASRSRRLLRRLLVLYWIRVGVW